MIEKVVYYVIWKMLNYIVSIFFKWNKIVRVRVRVTNRDQVLEADEQRAFHVSNNGEELATYTSFRFEW